MNSEEMADRIKLAEAMGWNVEEIDRLYGEVGMKSGRYGRLPHMSQGVPLPDPFTDANDDYAVLQWMRGKGVIGGKASRELSRFMIDYQIGDYARAALKVLK